MRDFTHFELWICCKRKISIEIMSYVCCMQRMQHIFNRARLSFCAFTRLHDAVNRLIFRFIKSIYMHRNHIYCKDMTQFLLIYTERQQHLCALAATNIQHSHNHCKDTTQLLHIYTLAWCSKLINFSIYQIDLHALQSHTLWKQDTVFAHIHRMTATSLRICCNSYTSYTYTLQRHNSAFVHLHTCVMQ